FSFRLPSATVFSPLSLHDALPISCFGASLKAQTARYAFAASLPPRSVHQASSWSAAGAGSEGAAGRPDRSHTLTSPPPLPFHFPDRKSTRLNSSHVSISYAVFCLK